jgi:alpha-galactosidase
VLAKVLAGPGQRAVGLLNRTDSPREITVHFDKLGRDDGSPGGLTNVTRVRNLWTHRNISSTLWEKTGSYTVRVPAHGIEVLKVWGEARRRDN